MILRKRGNAMFDFILGGCGTGKSYHQMEQIRQDLTAQKPVILLVPMQFSFEAEKRLYDYLDKKLFNRMKTYSFSTLSQEILLRYGDSGKNYASEQEKLLFLYQAVQECAQKDALTVLKKLSSPEDLLSLQKLISKLRKEGVTAEKMQDFSVSAEENSLLRDKTRDIAEILSAYDRILQEHGLCDSLNDLTSAAALAGKHGFFCGMHIYVDEFGTFSGDQYQMLETMMHQAGRFSIALRADNPGRKASGIFDGGNQTFLNLKQMAQEIRPDSVRITYRPEYRRSPYQDLEAVGSQIFRSVRSSAPYQGHVHVFQAEDPVSEVEYICAEIYQLLSSYDSLHCRDIAIAVKDPEVYRPLLERAFARYHLPYDIAAQRPVLHTALIRAFLSLLEILSAEKEKDSGNFRWNTDALLRYLKNDVSGYGREKTAMLEQFCFVWNIRGTDWNEPFYVSGRQEINQKSEPFGGEELEALRCAFLAEITELRTQCEHTSVRKFCRVLYSFLQKKKEAYEAFLLQQKTVQGTEVLKQNELSALWKLLGQMMNTVVSSLDSEIVSVKELYQIFLMLCKSTAFSVPPETLDSIRVIETLYEVLTVRLSSPKVVFVPGVVSGIYPGTPSPGGIFTEKELEQLEQSAQKLHITRLLPELYSEELLVINQILASPSERLYLTFPETDISHEPADPSSVIGDVCSMFQDESVLIRQDMLPPEYYAWTEESAYFHFVRNFKRNDAETASLRALLEQNPLYASRIRKLTETHTDQPIQASPETMRHLLGSQILLSPSGIEKFYQCPFQYFCTYCLKLYLPQKAALNPLSIGNLAHYCLEKILSAHPKDFLQLTPEKLETELRTAAECFKTENFSKSEQKDSSFLINYEYQIQSLLQMLLHMQEELKQSSFVPAAFEAKVDHQEVYKPYSLRNGSVLCHGKIDRVDLCHTEEQNMMRVVDYKTGNKSLTPEKIAHGLDMQMLIYLLALEQNGAFGNAVPVGVLYLPCGQLSGEEYQDREHQKLTQKDLLDEHYQVRGLLREDSVPYMQKEVSAPADIMNHKVKDTLFRATPKQFDSMKQHVEKKICEMADKLYEGKIAPDPYLYQSYSPCTYCPCAELCGNVRKEKLNYSEKEKKEALRQVFENQTDEEEQKS